MQPSNTTPASEKLIEIPMHSDTDSHSYSRSVVLRVLKGLINRFISTSQHTKTLLAEITRQKYSSTLNFSNKLHPVQNFLLEIQSQEHSAIDSYLIVIEKFKLLIESQNQINWPEGTTVATLLQEYNKFTQLIIAILSILEETFSKQGILNKIASLTTNEVSSDPIYVMQNALFQNILIADYIDENMQHIVGKQKKTEREEVKKLILQILKCLTNLKSNLKEEALIQPCIYYIIAGLYDQLSKIKPQIGSLHDFYTRLNLKNPTVPEIQSVSNAKNAAKSVSRNFPISGNYPTSLLHHAIFIAIEGMKKGPDENRALCNKLAGSYQVNRANTDFNQVIKFYTDILIPLDSSSNKPISSFQERINTIINSLTQLFDKGGALEKLANLSVEDVTAGNDIGFKLIDLLCRKIYIEHSLNYSINSSYQNKIPHIIRFILQLKHALFISNRDLYEEIIRLVANSIAPSLKVETYARESKRNSISSLAYSIANITATFFTGLPPEEADFIDACALINAL